MAIQNLLLDGAGIGESLRVNSATIRPVMRWERDPATGQNRPGSVQETHAGLPLWEADAAVLTMRFGVVREESVVVTMAAASRPERIDVGAPVRPAAQKGAQS